MKGLNYGIIGNNTTAALVSEDGWIDWLCMPEFDSTSVFAAILDRDKGGTFGFEMPEGCKTRQEYVPHTNMLTTHYTMPEGSFDVVDFMPIYRLEGSDHMSRPSEIYRYIRLTSGKPRLKVVYKPAPDYARGKTNFIVSDEYIETYSDSNPKDRQYLYSSLPLDDIIQQRELTLNHDQYFLLSYNEKAIRIDMDREKLEYCRTLVYWLNWTERTKKLPIYNDLVERSLLTLDLLSYKSGAMLAALTTSLPEAVGEERNWDYRFCWLRDASMSIETLFRVGHASTARRFMDFAKATFVSQHDFQIMYGIRGERILTESTLDNLSGYRNSRPVRIGNAAYTQRQNDSFGYLMDLAYQYFQHVNHTLDEVEDLWEMVKSIAYTVIEDWRKPDKGLWEIRGEGQHFVSSKVMCWVALDRATKIARLLGKDKSASQWADEAARIRTDVMQNGWNEDMHTFTQAYGNTNLDASLLLMESYGFIEPGDDRYKQTVHAVKEALLHDGLMYRYNGEDDFGAPKSAFTICVFWLIRALYVTGDKSEARKLFDRTLNYANHLGLFSEDINFETKEQLGNFPQAYSELAVVNTAMLFAQDVPTD